MEMSRGVSLLRTAQSLLTGRTIIIVYAHVHDPPAYYLYDVFPPFLMFFVYICLIIINHCVDDFLLHFDLVPPGRASLLTVL